jgi:hypothetical protein
MVGDAHPKGQIVMVGPVVKINPDALPRRPNLHSQGQRPYANLPEYLCGWHAAPAGPLLRTLQDHRGIVNFVAPLLQIQSEVLPKRQNSTARD